MTYPYDTATTATSESTFGTGTITAADLIQSMKIAMASIPACPIATRMKLMGLDPDDGWVMMVPISMWKEYDQSAFTPSYVRPSHLIDSPTCVRVGKSTDQFNYNS